MPNGNSELLARVDERTEYILKTLDEIKDAQLKQNDTIQKALDRTVSNTTWRKAHTWIIGGIIATLIAFLARFRG